MFHYSFCFDIRGNNESAALKKKLHLRYLGNKVSVSFKVARVSIISRSITNVNI